MPSFGSGPHAAALVEALRALLAPVVLVAAIAGLLLGLQRNYVGTVTTLRSLNVRRREGETAARRQFYLMYQSASLHARAITLLYAATVFLLLSSCATGTLLYLERETGHRESSFLLTAISWSGLICFIAGILLPLQALLFLLRGVSLPLKSVEEE